MRRFMLTVATIGLVAAATAPVVAQSVPVETRVDRLEKEMRAVQRKVFPGGAPVQPDVAAPVAPAGTGSTSPVVDLTARVDAIETQLATLTGQVEQNNFKLKQLEDAFAKYRADTDARLGTAPAPAPAKPAAAAVTPPAAAPAAAKPAAPEVAAPAPAKPAAATPAAATPAAAAAKPKVDDAARKKAVAAIERPSSGNAGEDSYTYGYRLWAAKFYPEAQVQLKSTVEKFGTTSVGSRAANLLGRAYLDDGKPALAASSFFDNYQKRPRGDRAAESLAYLGEALIQLKKLPGACKAYGELESVYGSSLTESQRTMMQKGRARAKCAA